MKKHLIALSIASSLCITTPLITFAKDNSSLIKNNDRIVIKSADLELKKSQVNQKLKAMLGGTLPEGKTDLDDFDDNTKENLLKGLVISTILEKEADKEKIEQTDTYKEHLKLIAKDLAKKELISKRIEENITETKISDSYKKLVDELKNKEEIKARHILVAKEEEAKEIVAKLKAGEPFEELAKQKSIDPAKDKGGDLGYFSKGQMIKSFEDTAFALKINEISAPVKTDFGWHIIKLEDKRKVVPPTIEESRNQLKAELTQQFIQEYTNKLFNDAKVELILK